MKKKPKRVTKLGASHMGSSSTKPFHCLHCQRHSPRVGWAEGPYVVFKDVAGDEGLVDARVFVRFEVLERVVRDAFVLGRLCVRRPWLAMA